MAGVRASLLCICFTRTDKAIVMRSQIRSRSPRTYFLINEFGGWRAGNYRQSPPGNCQKGSGFWKVRAGPEVTKVVSARLSITMLGWGQVEAPPMTVGPHTGPHSCSAGEEAGSRQVQSLAQGHTVPKGQSRTYT